MGNIVAKIQSGEMFSIFQQISPEKAKQLLSLMPRNRNINKSRVKSLSRLMSEGKWDECHPQGLIFNKQGELIDGQHRLYAVIDAGKTVQFYCTYNAEDNCILNIDNGMPRSTHQTGQILGLNTDKFTLAITRALLLDLKNPTKTNRNIEGVKILEMFESYRESIIFAKGESPKTAILYAPIRAVIARAHYNCELKESLYYGKASKLKTFVEVLDTGFSSDESQSSAIALRNSYLSTPFRNCSSQSGKIKLVAKAAYAIDAFLNNRPCRNVKEVKEQIFPIPSDFYE